MQLSTTFDSTKEQLSDMLASIRSAKTQLPDFQRGWVWDDDHIKSLLASISRSFPVGAVMMLQTGNANVRFKPRAVEGAPPTNGTEPERLILDGQQRLTSLYQALFAGQPAATKDSRGNPIKRWYYIRIPLALDKNADREDAIIGLPEDRMVRTFRGEIERDFSTTEKECQHELFPLPLIFDQAGFTDWQLKYIQADSSKIAERLARWNDFVQVVVQPFQQYQVPLILLRKETPKEAVCQVFEKVNTGGVALTVFELLTATFAADNFNLREDWDRRSKRLKAHHVLRSVENTDVLQAVTLLATYDRRVRAIASGTKPDDAPGVSCKRKDVLQLTLSDYETWIEPVTRGFERTSKFLYAQRFFAARDLPYRTQLVPLAATLALLGDHGDNDGVKTKLARWFWCGVFGELYGGAIESRFARDLVELVAWTRDGAGEPSTINDANFVAGRLLTLRTRNSAAYKGIYALLMLDGGLDFRTGDAIDLQTYFDDKIDIHHIFPQKYCAAKRLDRRQYDSIVNKTAISAKTNRMIGGNAPTAYLAKIEKSAGISTARMDDILRSHVIDPALLRADDFQKFIETRERALLARIEKAMGKQARAGGADPIIDDTVEPDEEADEAEDDGDAASFGSGTVDAVATADDVSTGQEPWNGDYYVSFGHSERGRRWEDALRFGFVSGGGGLWYSRTLAMLEPNDRIFVLAPGYGYVGVGIVLDRAVKGSEFMVRTENGQEVPLPKADGVMGYYAFDRDDDDRAEHFVRVRWLKTVGIDRAVKEVGLFGNQNTVCKPTVPKWTHTVRRLSELFGVT